MSNVIYTFFLAVFIQIMIPSQLLSQQIWPGDINNNGVANGIDLLYLGEAFSHQGTQRPNANANWQGQAMGDTWNENFPNGINYAYADADGNGVINGNDLSDALLPNFKKTHGSVTPDVFSQYEGGNSPALYLLPASTTVGAGEMVLIRIMMGSNGAPIQNLQGAAFTFNYDPELVIDGSFQGSLIGSSNGQLGNGEIRSLVVNDDANGITDMAFTHTSGGTINGQTEVGRIMFFIENGIEDDTLLLSLDQIQLIDPDMNILPVAHEPTMLFINGGGTVSACPDVLDPVCGANGVTYLNSCYAEEAGVTDYTEGTCFGGCIDPNDIDPDADCSTNYEPVCGCNNITYLNACAADAAGVSSYTQGPCNLDNCYVPDLILIGAGTSVDNNTGVISVDCPDNDEPVCGCNGITYENSCYAEAAGISFYTSGACSDICVDPDQMDPDATCVNVYEPVCGCNGVTYTNSCYADAAGVVSYTQGTCGANSNWCAEATPIQCGDFLAHETTVGSGNQISSYPGCSNASFAGQDKVYVFNKTSAGDIQIGLEILTPGLDLDLFLLAGDCGQLTCLRSSTSNNSLTNNEGILLENAPIGTYFIVVDGQFSGSNGEYHLEVSCGYLDCSDEQELTCGEPFQYNNMYGNDDVSLYGCDGNIYNVENNGPEVVHYFTVTEAGPVNITLEDLDDNLELFLLDDCDRGACMEYSQNAGTTDEHIGTFLQPGTYYIVVDGYNGAISDYTLTVDCSSNCDFDLDLAATDAACGQNNGSISVVSSGGTPAFLVTYSGPVSGSFTTLSNSCTISNLPGGVYTITKTDANGCSVTQTVNVNSSGNLSVSASTNDAICGEPGAIYVSINNGDAPYTVYVSGPVSGTTVVTSSSFTLNALPAGNYDLYIVDGSGCSVTESVQIDAAANAFSFTATPDDALCGQLGSIYIETDNGSGPYTVFLTGPVNGSAVVHAPNFNLINLPGGTYTLTIEDGNWCASTQTVTVNDEDLDVSALPLNGICGEDGALLVSIPNGTPGYTISWSGPENGSTTTNNDSYTIEDLTGGTYTISVTDAQGCSDVFVATVDNNGNAIDTDFMIMDATCDMDGSIWIDINNGTWPFDVEFTGPVSGDFVTSLYEVDIPNLPCGTYTVVITDYNGCSSTLTLNIGCGGDLAIDLDPVFTDCGADNEINVSISGGSPAYIVTWSGPESGTATTSDDSFTIENLTEGFYSVFVTDSEGCSASSSFYLNLSSTSDLDISANGLQAICSQPGSIWLSIFGGSPDYTVIWNGPSSGSLTTSNTGLTIPNLPTGAYSITVLDGNGCSATDDVIIQNSNGNFNVNVSPLNGACVNLGGIYVNIYAGEGPYDIIWTGPENGSITTGNNNYTIPDLPSGSYTVTVIDENGCEDIESVYLFNGMSVVDLNATPTSGLCGELGNILVNVSGGAPTYVITWSSGAVTGSANINSNSFNITNLPSGTYTVTVMDANGCTDYIVTNIDNANDDLDVTLITTEATCTSLGEIFVDIDGGDGPYTIEWSGSLNGQTVMNDDGFTIANAPGGAYTIVVEDSNGCTETEVVFVPESTDEVFLEGSAINGICGANGSIQLDISGGLPAYDIIWTGPVDGSASTANETFTIPNLPSGTYTITVLDQNGCQNSISINLNNGNGDITIQTTPVPGDCAQNGSIWVDIYGLAGFYSIAWTGPVNGSIGTTNNGYNIPNLPSGTYLVTVTHESGCTDSEQVVLINDNNSLDVIAVANNGVCESGFIHVGMTGGSAPYTVTWTGPVNGSATTTDNFYNITNIPSGTYTVTVVGANGCTDTETVTIINDDGDLEIHASLIVNDCGVYNWIWVDIFNGTGPYIIMWTGPENGTVTDDDGAYEITDLPPGTYTIKVTDANGCMTTVEITIYESQANLLEVVGQNGDCGELGQATATIIGGTPPYSLVWTGPFSGSTPLAGGSFQLSNLPSGTYNFTLTDAMGCVDQESIVISNPNELVVNMTMDNGECGLNGSIGLTFTGGLGTYTITWSGPASGSSTVTGNVFTINDLPTGSYTVTVEDESGCLESETVVINNLPNDLDIIPTPIDGVCDQNGSIWLDILNGVGPYVVQWTGPVSGSVTLTVNGTNIPNLPAGTYTVTVIDANGCTVSETVDVDVVGSDFEVSMTSNSGECGLLGSIDLFISGSDGPYTINWTGPVNGSGTSNGGLFTVSNLPTGQYIVTITDANGCVIVDPAFINNIPDNFDVFAVPTDAVCDQNGFIHLGWTGGVANYTVTWSGPVSGSATVDGVSYNILNLPSGVYTVTVVDGNGCEETLTVTVNNIDNDLEIHASLIVNDCGVYNWIWVDIFGGTGPYIIMWTGPVNGTVTDDDGAYEIIDLPPGTYTIKVTDQNGCMVTQVITVYESQANLLDVVGTNGDCGELGSAVATIVSGTPPYTLTWTGPFSGTTPLAGGSFTLNNLPNGTYNFTLTDAMGCVDQETIVINSPIDDLVVNMTHDNGDCGGLGTVGLMISGGSGTYTITWTGTVSGSTTITGSNFTLNDLPSGNYTFEVVDANGCNELETAFINNLPNDLEIIPTPIDGVCDQNGSIWLDILNGQAPYTVQWSGPVSGSTILNVNGTNIPNLPAGTYTVTVTDANGCSVSETVVVDVLGSDLDVAMTSNSGACGLLGSIDLLIDGTSAPYTITWTGPVNGSGTSNGGLFTVSNLPTGQYTVTITDANGCVIVDPAFINNIPDDFDVFAVPTDAVCDQNGFIHLGWTGGTPNYTVTWSGPVSGSTVVNGVSYNILDLPSGVYTVTVTDANGCEETVTVTVNNIDNDLEIHASLIVNDCGVYNWIWIDIFGGTGPYIIMWTGPVNGTVTDDDGAYEITDLPPGTYTVKVTDQNGCMVTQVITVYESEANLLDVNAQNGICGNLGSATAVIVGGTPPFSLTWNGPVSGSTNMTSTGFLLSDLPNGTYEFVLTDSLGCVDSETITIENADSDVSLELAAVNGVCGQPGSVFADFSGGVAPYTVSWSGPVSGSATTSSNGYNIPGLPGGTYTITVTDANGCSDTQAANVVVPADNLSVALMIFNGNCGENGSVMVMITGDGAPYTISWNGPVNGSATTSNTIYDITDLVSGVYSVVIANSDGCSETQSITITNDLNNVDLTATTTDGLCGALGSIQLNIAGGLAPYTVNWSGPINGSTSVMGNSLGLTDLPNGIYTLTVTDANGCTDTEVVTLNSQLEVLNLTTSAIGGVCGDLGAIQVNIIDGVPGYTISWAGPVSGSENTNNGTFTIDNLPEGSYTVSVTDASGCDDTEVVQVVNGPDNFGAVLTPLNGSCNNLGSIWIDIFNGSASYIISWSGPVSGSIITADNFYDIIDLPTGNYTITIVDANGCTYVETVYVVNPGSDLDMTLVPTNGACGLAGALEVQISGGTPDYTITWNGTVNGQATVSSSNYLITDLPTGNYTVVLADDNGCTVTESMVIMNDNNDLSVSFNANSEDCASLGSIDLNITGASMPYTVSWFGPSTGEVDVMSNDYTIEDLTSGFYTVTVEGAMGCSSMQSVFVGMIAQAPTADFVYMLDGLTVTLMNQSVNATEFNWDFGDGNESSDESPVYTFSGFGTYEICLEAINACGDDQSCQTLVLNPTPGTVILDVDETMANEGSSIQLPVFVQNCDMMVSLAGSVELSNPDVATVTGVTSGAIAPTFNNATMSFNFYDAMGAGVSLNDNDVLFYLNIDVTGVAGEMTEITLVDTPTSIEVGGFDNDTPTVLPHLALSGSVTVTSVNQVEGSVETYWGEGVSDVEIGVDDPNYDVLDLTDDNGSYMLEGLPSGQEYTIKATKDTDPANGLSTFALFIGQRFLLGLEPPQITSPYQIIAADANCSGSFTTLDLFMIQQNIIGVADGFGDCPSWVFVAQSGMELMPEEFNAYNVFPYATEEVMTVMQDTFANFTGVKIGDIMGHANPTLLHTEDVDDRNLNQLTFVADNRPVKAGEEVAITFAANNFRQIASYQMDLRFDADYLSFIDFATAQEEMEHTQIGQRKVEEGQLRISWFDLAGFGFDIADDAEVFTLRFTATRDIEDLSGLFSVSSDEILTEAHQPDGDPVKIELAFAEANTPTAGFELYQNRPNPFRNQTLIGFELPEAMDAEIIVHDHVGRVITRIEDQFAKGYNTVTLDRAQMSAGVYYYTLKAKDFTATKNMIILE